MMYEELIKRLREAPSDWPDAELHYEAADAIEKLIEVIQNHDFLESLIKPDWIPVTERLPEEKTDCLIFVVSGEFGQFSWISMAFFYNGVFRYDDHWGEFDHITHWTPLPQPPESEKQNG